MNLLYSLVIVVCYVLLLYCCSLQSLRCITLFTTAFASDIVHICVLTCFLSVAVFFLLSFSIILWWIKMTIYAEASGLSISTSGSCWENSVQDLYWPSTQNRQLCGYSVAYLAADNLDRIDAFSLSYDTMRSAASRKIF